MNSEANGRLGAVKIHVPENPRFLTQKCIKSLLYLYERHLEDGDWFLKADDDTYVIVENLRYLLSFYDPDVPWMTGHHLRVPQPGMGKGYFSGRAGYVMSRAALKKFVEEGSREENAGMTTNSLCRRRTYILVSACGTSVLNICVIL
jgi:glycoprotein-N-acetylgalactosamine 3-beta-galactosyltransferase